MFWNRRPKRDAPAESPASRADGAAGRNSNGAVEGAAAAAAVARDAAFDSALDSLAVILRASAENWIEVGDGDGADPERMRPDEALLAWAEHVLLITPAPESMARPGVRDWRGLQRFTKILFANQKRSVETALGDFREVIGAFTSRLAGSVVADAAGDGQAAVHLSRLQEAVSGRSPAELKEVALETVEGLEQLMEERQARQQEMARDLGERIRALSAELVEAQREATTDALTRLGNRTVLERALGSALDYRVLLGEPAALVMVDIDHFKRVNDNHGHPAGDAVLRALADRLVLHFPRQADCVVRYGGEEFALVLRDCDGAAARHKAEAMREAVRRMTVEHAGQALLITVSAGVAECVPGESAEEWMERADAALYRAKEGGRDRVEMAAVPIVAGPAGALPIRPRPTAAADRAEAPA
jgi:diguanylate cyclase